MSNERKSPEMDTLVAKTYKALATERAPDHLNEKVMAMAARESRTRYGQARTWIRPLAWAATVGLSLAIVLDLTQLPGSGVDTRDHIAPLPPAAAPADSAARRPPQEEALAGSTPMNVTREDAKAAVSQADDAAAKGALASLDSDERRDAEELPRASTHQPAVEAPRESMRIEPVLQVKEKSTAEPVEAEPAIAASPPRDALASTSSPSRDIARRRADAGESLAASSFSMGRAEQWPESDRPCPAALRETATSWLSCIADLRDEGRDDLADYEASEFERKYPSYKAPAAHK